MRVSEYVCILYEMYTHTQISKRIINVLLCPLRSHMHKQNRLLPSSAAHHLHARGIVVCRE